MKNDVVLCQKGNIFYEDQKPISAPAVLAAELSVSDKFPSKCLYISTYMRKEETGYKLRRSKLINVVIILEIKETNEFDMGCNDLASACCICVGQR